MELYSVKNGTISCRMEEDLSLQGRQNHTNQVQIIQFAYISLLPIPMGVACHIEKIQWDFLWGGVGDEFKFHLVNWKNNLLTNSMSGLGIKNCLV